jgi:hypothetical protein
VEGKGEEGVWRGMEESERGIKGKVEKGCGRKVRKVVEGEWQRVEVKWELVGCKGGKGVGPS